MLSISAPRSSSSSDPNRRAISGGPVIAGTCSQGFGATRLWVVGTDTRGGSIVAQSGQIGARQLLIDEHSSGAAPRRRYSCRWPLLSFLIVVGSALAVAAPSRASSSPAPISNCANDAQLQAAAAAGGSHTFDCSGKIYLSGTITVAKTLTIDAGGRSVIINGSACRVMLGSAPAELSTSRPASR